MRCPGTPGRAGTRLATLALTLLTLSVNLAGQGISAPPGGTTGGGGSFTVASQAAAEAATNNTDGMTPLRVKQALQANVQAGSGMSMTATATGVLAAVSAAVVQVSSGTSVPGSCTSVAQVFIDTDAASGAKMYYCNGTTYEAPSVSAGTETRTCEMHIWGSGASQVLQNTDDELASCKNKFGTTETITAVDCWADAGSPTVTPILTGGSATSILSGALTCGTASWAAGTLSGTPTLTSNSTVDANVTAAGGTATNIRLVITLTR